MRSVAVIFRFFFAAKSYVQNGFEVPTLSTSGVVRTGSCSFAGRPSRPRIARVNAKTSARGSGFASRAALMSGSVAARDPVGSGVPFPAVEVDPSGDGDGARAGGVHAVTMRSAAASPTSILIPVHTPRAG